MSAPTPSEAEALILARLPRMPAEDCPLLHAQGRVLSRDIAADRDLPAYDRVTMDGYALRAEAVEAGRREFRIGGVQAAGMMALNVSDDAECIEVMTGAILPRGADAVVPYEDTVADKASRVVTLREGVVARPGQSVHRKGSDHGAGARVLPAGVRLSAREIAVLATVGCTKVPVAQRPSVAVVSTGDELVEPSAADLAPHQVRRSNDIALRAALLDHGLVSRVERFHVRDLRPEVETVLRRVIAEFDVVVLTGGVSKGKYDFVPQVLDSLGVMRVLQGIAQRPGKPMAFGVTARRTAVFALPGNPVSACTCFHRYLVPALEAMAGMERAPEERVVLSAPVPFPAKLSFLLPVAVEHAPDGRRLARPVPFNTSGDLAGLVGTDGFVELPRGPAEHPAGLVVPFFRWW